MLLPAAATCLSILASVLVFFPHQRGISKVAAIGCLVIYAIFVMSVILTHPPRQHYVEVVNSLPAGRFFRSFIPLIAATAVICFDIFTFKKDHPKDD
jgi:Mn2+/Fe2+ NRAMP family transporter